MPRPPLPTILGFNMLRAAVIGARRARQGIGFHLARFCAGAGTDVVGVVGTRTETAEAAQQALSALGIHPRSYTDAEEMVAHEQPDLLVVASPSTTHERYLRLALEAGCHVLCEKPLCWGGSDAARTAREIVDAFVARGLHLGVNAQWPFTLETYRELFPEVLEAAPRTFRMRLSPRRRGLAMLPDALPHAFSLLAAVLPDPAAEVSRPEIRSLRAGDSHLDVRFDYVAQGVRVACAVELKTNREQPREAGYGFDDRYARRVVDIEPPHYRLAFEGDGRRLDLADPTPRLVGAVLARVSSSSRPEPDLAAWPAMAHVQAVTAVWDARRIPNA